MPICAFETFEATSRIGRVEVWRGDVRPSMSVSAPFVWRCLSGLRNDPHWEWLMPDDAVRPVKFHAYPKSSGIVLRMIHQEINEIYGESDGGGGCGSPRGEAAEFGPLIAADDVPRFHRPQGSVSDARHQRPQFDLLSETQNRFRHSIKPVITRISGAVPARRPRARTRPALRGK